MTSKAHDVRIAQIENYREIEALKLGEGRRCLVTWYGDYFHGRTTYSGEVYDQWGLSAASTTYPIGTKLLVCTDKNCVKLHVNDKGAFTHCLDLSRGAFNQLGSEGQGVLKVTVYGL